MATKRLPANADVLRWARRQHGYDLQTAASLLGIDVAELAAIEDADEFVPSAVLSRMRQVYEVSESVLLLPKPPPVRPIPEDFRTPQGLVPRLSPDTRMVIREAWEFVEDATALLFDDIEPSELLARTPVAAIDDDPSLVASNERTRIGVSLDQQQQWKGASAIDHWRQALDNIGIMVLLKAMPWDDCRGCLLWSTDLIPAMLINSRDTANARVFTVFHEYAHLLLREPSACIQTDADASHAASEMWCNRFAAAFLMPRDSITEAVERKMARKALEEWTMSDYRNLGGKFHVSSMAMARRLKDMYGVTFYDDHFAELRGTDKKSDPKKTEQSSGPAPAVVRRAEVGVPLIHRVARAISSAMISHDEAAGIFRLSSAQFRRLTADSIG